MNPREIALSRGTCRYQALAWFSPTLTVGFLHNLGMCVAVSALVEGLDCDGDISSTTKRGHVFLPASRAKPDEFAR